MPFEVSQGPSNGAYAVLLKHGRPWPWPDLLCPDQGPGRGQGEEGDLATTPPARHTSPPAPRPSPPRRRRPPPHGLAIACSKVDGTVPRPLAKHALFSTIEDVAFDMYARLGKMIRDVAAITILAIHSGGCCAFVPCISDPPVFSHPINWTDRCPS